MGEKLNILNNSLRTRHYIKFLTQEHLFNMQMIWPLLSLSIFFLMRKFRCNAVEESNITHLVKWHNIDAKVDYLNSNFRLLCMTHTVFLGGLSSCYTQRNTSSECTHCTWAPNVTELIFVYPWETWKYIKYITQTQINQYICLYLRPYLCSQLNIPYS